tara:strand:- start:172 stop:531 length:360 start_codon:yes stop_codon:yes gene_type:complete
LLPKVVEVPKERTALEPEVKELFFVSPGAAIISAGKNDSGSACASNEIDKGKNIEQNKHRDVLRFNKLNMLGFDSAWTFIFNLSKATIDIKSTKTNAGLHKIIISRESRPSREQKSTFS